MTDASNRKHPILRRIVDAPTDGAVNMAVDQAILDAVNNGTSGATLRCYQWSQPTISLGYFQSHTDHHDQHPNVAALPMVRRQTGGGAILHDDELTYSLILPLDDTLAPGTTDIETLYRLVHDAFITALGELGIAAAYRGGSDRGNAQRGPFFCFARGHRLDVVVHGEKILGSAQRRVKNAVLQHGSLILANHFSEQPAAAVRTIINGPFDLEAFVNRLGTLVAASLKLDIKDGPLTDAERTTAQDLTDHYRSESWNRLR